MKPKVKVSELKARVSDLELVQKKLLEENNGLREVAASYANKIAILKNKEDSLRAVIKLLTEYLVATMIRAEDNYQKNVPQNTVAAALRKVGEPDWHKYRESR